MRSTDSPAADAPKAGSRCPLCGAPNLCTMAAGARNAAGCWCGSMRFDDAAVRQAAAFPEACICAACVRTQAR